MSDVATPPNGPAESPADGDASPYSERETRAWLAWLARQMQRTNESIFLIERLQPDCLTSSAQRAGYLALNALVLGSFTGTIITVVWWISHKFDPPCPAEANIPWWMWIGVYCIWSLAMGALDLWRLPWITPALQRSTGRRWPAMGLRIAIMFATSMSLWVLLQRLLGAGYSAWAGMGPAPLLCDVPASNMMSLRHAWLSSWLVALVYGAKMQGETDVTPVEAMGWSWRSAGKGLVPGLLAGLVVWVVYALDRYGEIGEAVLANLKLYPPIGAAAGFIIGGLSVSAVSSKLVPNQGIHLSLLNALKAAALLGGIVTLIAWPILVLAIPGENVRHDGWQASLTLGGMAALIGFVWRGGREVILHWSLRAVLAMTRQAPANLARFLDHAANDLEFMRKVGGGYMFIHRYLLEHFAASETPR